MLTARALPRPRAASLIVGLLVALVLPGCMDRQEARKVAQALQAGSPEPDEVPVMLNRELPFRYPAALYERRIQGNVTLRLFVDRDGNVHRDSTRVEESSGFPSLDSAAVRGSQELRFIPAKLQGEPLAISILFPVYFRHPEASALPGDTILRGEQGATAAARGDSARAPRAP